MKMKMRVVTIALLVLVGALLALAGAKHKEDDDVFVSAQAQTGGDGSFNIDALCPDKHEVITGGYEILSGGVAVLTSSNTFHFHSNSEGEVEADGWQTIGFVLLQNSNTPAIVRVTASCEKEGKKE